MDSELFYSTDIEWTGERHGDLGAPVLPRMHVDAPPEFKGHEGVWTPEHLFVGSVNTCYMTTFLAIAENSKLDFVSFKAEARGKLEKANGSGLMITEIILRPKLTIQNPRDSDKANRILEKAERNCLISNSVKTKIRLEPQVSVVEPGLLNA